MQKHWRQRLWELTPRFLTSRSIPLSLVFRSSLAYLKRFYHHTSLYRWTLPNQADSMVSAAVRSLWFGDEKNGAAIKNGAFAFGSIETSYPNLWQQHIPEYFWSYFHGFSWLQDTKPTTDDQTTIVEQIINDWISRHPIGHGLAWDIDITARRLDAWINYLDSSPTMRTADVFANFVLHLKKHWFHLYNNLPGPLFGSTLILSIKSFLKGWLLLSEQLPMPDYFFNRFSYELQQQFLSTESYAERNPSAQLMLLAHLIDLSTAFRENNQPVPDIWQESIVKLAKTIFYIQRPDGGLPGFNGSNREESWHVQQILLQSRLNALELFSNVPVHLSGYCRLQAGKSVVLLDTGLLPDVPYDASMHAGALSFEFYAGSDAIIVNCGSNPNPIWHDVQRATAAHSTLIMNDTNSSFLGRNHGIIKGPHLIKCQRQEENGNWWLEASHDGYQKLFGATHTRLLYLSHDGFDLRGEDILESKIGHRCVVRFHLHPDTLVKLEPSQQTAILKVPSGQSWQLRTMIGNIDAEESVYLGPNGIIHKSQQLVIGNLPTDPNLKIKWALTRKES